MAGVATDVNDIIPEQQEPLQVNDGDSPLDRSGNTSTSSEYLVKDDPVLKEALQFVARRRAAEVALISVTERAYNAEQDDKFGDKAREYKQLKTKIEALNAKAQHGLMQTLNKMDVDTLLYLTFKLVDSDDSKNVSLHELANILQLIRGGKRDAASSEEALRAAELTVNANDSDGDGCLDYEEFGDFVISMVDFLEKSVENVAFYLVAEITSLYSGSFIIDEFTDVLGDDESSSTKISMKDRVRLYIVFQLIQITFPGDEEGRVEFAHVFEAMSAVSNNMEDDFQMMLSIVEDDKEKKLFTMNFGFTDFSDFFEKVVCAYLNNLDIDFLLDIMTAQLCQGTVEESEKNEFETTTSWSPLQRKLNNTNNDWEMCNEDKKRVKHLFNLWKEGSHETLHTSKLFSGLRMYHESKGCDKRMLEIISKMEKNQENEASVQTMSIDQCEKMLMKFTDEVGVHVSTLVDFMYMQTLIKGNHSPEKTIEREDWGHTIINQISFARKSNRSSSWSILMDNLANEEIKLSK